MLAPVRSWISPNLSGTIVIPVLQTRKPRVGVG